MIEQQSMQDDGSQVFYLDENEDYHEENKSFYNSAAYSPNAQKSSEISSYQKIDFQQIENQDMLEQFIQNPECCCLSQMNILCKIHNKEATRICLSPICTLEREVCEDCEKQTLHETHGLHVVYIKQFLFDVENCLKEYGTNSSLMKVYEVLELGRQFIQSHFQKLINMLAAKFPLIVKIFALIEQTENAKKVQMKNYELERFIHDINSFVKINESGKFEYQNLMFLNEQGIVKEEIDNVLLILKYVENDFKTFHDDFTKALRFPYFQQFLHQQMSTNSQSKKETEENIFNKQIILKVCNEK